MAERPRPPAADVPRVRHNDWSSLSVPDLGRWRPTRSVSVVVPAYQCQSTLDLVLAALAYQTYPAHLLEVVVVDDGSQPPLELPKLRPEHTRLVRVDSGWGRANALRVGAAASHGDIIHWLDADMLVHPEHVEAQARWHHVVPYAVTLGWKRFVDPPWPTPEEVADACAAGRADRLFAGRPSQGHDYVERYVARTAGLREADHLAFLVHVGATAALRRELYDAAGGMDASLRLGEDTELGFRLAQAGAVFVPEPAARGWHLGPSHMMRHREALQRYNRPFLAERMPLPRWLRRRGGAGAVPLVTAVVDVTGHRLEEVCDTVDSLLRGEEPDLRVVLVGPWQRLTGERVPPLSDPWLDLRLIEASYRADPRVRLARQAPASVFPSPYLLRVPATRPLPPDGVRRLVQYADQERLGLVRTTDGVELWRTAAVGRARWVQRAGESLADVVSDVYGAATVPGDQVGRRPPPSVEVAGVRSLVRAAGLVAWLAADRARARLRRLAAPQRSAGPRTARRRRRA
ncbi:MAG: glycosyltransferase [Micromonosporaceae bacterium]|jgi:glycosyltransferase involved in cell wall biosynthesis